MTAATRSGATPIVGPAPAGRAATLERQLATAQAKLDDWVTCPSHVTPEGKAKIAEFTNKVDAIKVQIDTADPVRSPRAAAAAAVSSGGVKAVAAGAATGAATATRAATATGGVDVYA